MLTIINRGMRSIKNAFGLCESGARKFSHINASNILKIRDVFIVGFARTPIGAFQGSLCSFSATDLGSIAVRGAIDKSLIQPNEVEEVFMGNVYSGNLGQAPAKTVASKAGLSPHTICTVINKVCASGMKAITTATQSIALHNSDVIVAGGMESMTNAPYYLERTLSLNRSSNFGDRWLIDSIFKDGLVCPTYRKSMGEIVEIFAEKFSITREMQDNYAIKSYKRAIDATKNGLFAYEIIPIELPHTRGIFQEDEQIYNVDYDKISRLKGSFLPDGNGTVTAANASSFGDGASAVVLASDYYVVNNRIRPVARILAYADSECNSMEFPLALANVISKVLSKSSNISMDDISLFEINEAFSVVCELIIKILNLNREKVNIVGGSVATGHPLGSSGCKVVVTLCGQLKSGQLGIAAVCNGGGGASALLLEKL